MALDTTYILGRGAVKDTYNLLADGIVKLLRVLAAVANIAVGEWAEGQGYQRYLGSSIKGEAVIDWSDRKARAALLAELVAYADRLLALARQAWVELPEDSAQRQSIVDGAELLGQLLLQDVERQSGDADADADDGMSLKDGVSQDRMPSVHDPELRHGHKSSRRRFKEGILQSLLQGQEGLTGGDLSVAPPRVAEYQLEQQVRVGLSGDGHLEFPAVGEVELGLPSRRMHLGKYTS